MPGTNSISGQCGPCNLKYYPCNLISSQDIYHSLPAFCPKVYLSFWTKCGRSRGVGEMDVRELENQGSPHLLH